MSEKMTNQQIAEELSVVIDKSENQLKLSNIEMVLSVLCFISTISILTQQIDWKYAVATMLITIISGYDSYRRYKLVEKYRQKTHQLIDKIVPPTKTN